MSTIKRTDLENLFAHGRHHSWSDEYENLLNDVSADSTTTIDFKELQGTKQDEDNQENILQLSVVHERPNDDNSSQLPTESNCLISLFATDAILKFFTVMFYGVLPCGLKKHAQKLRYACLSTILILLYWTSSLGMIYFYETSSIPREAVFLVIASEASVTLASTLLMYYFYRNQNNFRNDSKGGWSTIPNIKFDLATALDDGVPIGLRKKDWLLTNMFLLLGFCCSMFVASVHFVFKTCIYINYFREKMALQREIQYQIIFLTRFFADGAIIVSCCIFHVITRNLIRHIEYTENAILVRARNKDDFYHYHQSLDEYTDKMIASCKHWFIVHILFFTALVFIFVYEWFKQTKHGKKAKFSGPCQIRMLIVAIAASLMLAFTFAFPFISASRVTSKFGKFYVNLNMKCKIEGLPDLLMLSTNSGFKVCGFRINTNAAILTFISSFAGLLKIWHLLNK